MRPPILYPLFAEIESLPGIGPRIAPLVKRLAGPRRLDLLWLLPAAVLDRRDRRAIVDVEPGRIVTVLGRVGRHLVGSGRSPTRVELADGTGRLDLVYFKAQKDYLAKLLPAGAERYVSGKADLFGERLQMVHPDHVAAREEEIPAMEPVYPLTKGLTQRQLAKFAAAALDGLPALPEWLPEDLLAREGWPAWDRALMQLHRPQGQADLDAAPAARRRLAFDELLATQLAVQLIRARRRAAAGRPLTGDGRLTGPLRAALPYRLTGDQEAAIAAVQTDMAADQAMLRLVQGDVGSGKTMVALFAMAAAVEAGAQAVLLAPTELLARQHFAALDKPLSEVGVRTALLTGRVTGEARAALLEDLAAGRIQGLIGTHAVIQEPVAFQDLGLAVVDEQHRFGVFQRLALRSKARGGLDMLVMTATPIPRTLTLAVYGDMDVSRIVEKPPGRQRVDTRVVSLDRLDELVEHLERALERGARAYWVCPLVEEGEGADGAAAEARYEALKARFGARVGLVHGRMKGPDKDRAMAAFKAGDIQLLVATTVVEVGVDVPEATIMVIEEAERFGLAQLHQLRGRVGRGTAASSCLLLRRPQIGETARARLEILRNSEDGFLIAEEDLRLRGAGEVLGVRQSGLPDFRLADLERDQDLMALAHDTARLILARSPDLKGAEGERLRVLLYLFERDAAVRTLRSG